MANHNTIVNIKISRLVALYININNFFYIFSNNWDQASRYRNKWQPCIPYCKYTSTFDAHLIFLSLWRQISQRKYVIGGIFYDADSRGQGGGEFENVHKARRIVASLPYPWTPTSSLFSFFLWVRCRPFIAKVWIYSSRNSWDDVYEAYEEWQCLEILRLCPHG